MLSLGSHESRQKRTFAKNKNQECRCTPDINLVWLFPGRAEIVAHLDLQYIFPVELGYIHYAFLSKPSR